MFAKGKKDIDIKDILNIASESQLLSYYLGVRTIPCVINSPLRKDNNPSFGLYSDDKGKVHFKDFATKACGGTFDLLQEYFHLPLPSLVDKIYQDLNYDSGNIAKPRINSFTSKGRRTFSTNVRIQCKVREWKDYDIKYWSQYGVSLPWLKFSNTYPISHIIYTNNLTGKTNVFSADKYAYAYVEFKDGTESLKIYQPYSTEHKWLNNHDSSVWDLWTKLPKRGKDLIITSSRKDALCIWENSGIPAVSLQCESYLPKQNVIEELKGRFNNIYVLYDNDFTAEENYGRILGEKMATEFNLTQIEIPTQWESKDTSDLAKNHGKETVREVIFNLIKKQ